MKIIIVSAHFPGIFGGVSDYSLNLSRTLADMGNEIIVITSDNNKVITNQHKNLEVLPIIDKWDIRNIDRVYKTIQNYKPDCVFLQYVPYMYSPIGLPLSLAILAFVLWLKKIKLITTFHEVARKLNYTNPRYFLVSVSQRIIAYAISLFSIYIVISLERYRNMLFMFKSKVVRIPIGSSIIPVEISRKDEAKIKQKISCEGDFVVVTFGANPRRVDLLLNSISLLLHEGVNLKLVILGKFPDKWIDSLRASIRKNKMDKNIYLTGYLKAECIYKYLTIANLFVLIEGMDDYGYIGVSTKSTALAAAYTAGLPVLGSRGHMTDSFFKHKENIYFIDSLDEKNIASEIKSVINDTELLDKLKRGSEATYKDHLCWEVIANKYKALLNYQQ